MDLAQTYQATLQQLYKKLPMFTRIGAAAYKPNLDNTLLLCEKLKNPQSKFKSIHIAGTNGKGSCSALLAAAFQQSGYKTALYTSPHIVDFRERIKINGIDISKQYVVDFVKNHEKLIEDIQPSFFELTVAMAFTYFAEQSVDIAIIETGLGGLLDSTNIITPEVSVITNISNDHAYLLGETLQEIALQKAGIIKNKVPVVIGETQEALQKIFITTAIMHDSTLFFADNTYSAVYSEMKAGKQWLKIIDKSTMQLMNICTDLMGNYQSKNIITVLKTLDVMKNKGWDLSGWSIENVFANTKTLIGFKGRFDIVHQQPTIIFDVSHNEAGISALFEQIATLTYQTLYIITGFVKDKEIQEILQRFPKQANYYFVEAAIPRALPKEILYEMATAIGLKGEQAPTIQAGLQSAMSRASANDVILVTGSFFILEEAYHFIENNIH